MRTFNEIMGVGNADLKGLIMEKLPDSPIVTAKKKLYVPERKLILMDQLTEQEYQRLPLVPAAARRKAPMPAARIV